MRPRGPDRARPRRWPLVGASVVLGLLAAAVGGASLTGRSLPGLNSTATGSTSQASTPLSAVAGTALSGPSESAAPPSSSARPSEPADRKPGAGTAKTKKAKTKATAKKSTGVITTPFGRNLPACQYFSGISRLAAGDTLILAVVNLDNPKAGVRVDTVFDYRTPAHLASWRGVVSFSTGEIGQHLTVHLKSVSLRAAKKADTDSDPERLNRLAAQADELDSITIEHVEGGSPSDCPRPN